MAPKRNIDTVDAKPKKTRRSKAKKPKLPFTMSLEDAIIYGNIEFVKQFLKLDFDLNERNIDGKTALHLAVDAGNAEIVAELLSHGANPDLYICCRNVQCKREGNGQTALISATISENVQVVKELLKHSPNLRYSFQSSSALT